MIELHDTLNLVHVSHCSTSLQPILCLLTRKETSTSGQRTTEDKEDGSGKKEEIGAKGTTRAEIMWRESKPQKTRRTTHTTTTKQHPAPHSPVMYTWKYFNHVARATVIYLCLHSISLYIELSCIDEGRGQCPQTQRHDACSHLAWRPTKGNVGGGMMAARCWAGVWLAKTFSINEHELGMADGTVLRVRSVEPCQTRCPPGNVLNVALSRWVGPGILPNITVPVPRAATGIGMPPGHLNPAEGRVSRCQRLDKRS